MGEEALQESSFPSDAPSERQNCCQGADESEVAEVRHLVEYAESHRVQLAAIPHNENNVQQEKDTKAADEEKLKKVRESMNEATKKMAADQSELSKRSRQRKLGSNHDRR